MRDEADVAIVGAGPAGAACALLLARAGHDVLLLDRQAFPRPKPCGDCLSAAATDQLDRLGVLPDVLARRPARLHGWRIVAPDGSAFVGRFGVAPDGRPRTALSLSRDRLDETLVTAATRAGARLWTGLHVTDLVRDDEGGVTGVVGRHTTDGGRTSVRIGARLVVGADGLRSIVARRLGLIRRRPRRRKLSLTAHVHGIEAAGPAGRPRYGEMHVIDGACAGLAPVTDGATDAHNLTLVVDADRFGASVAADPLRFFWRALSRFPSLRSRIARAGGPSSSSSSSTAVAAATAEGAAAADGTPTPLPLHASGPFDWPTRDIVRHGAALVGDAGGYYDPFTGQGIFRALRTAELLVASVEPVLRLGSPTPRNDASRLVGGAGAPASSPSARSRAALRRALRDYARRHARTLRGARRVQRLIEHVVSRPALAGPAIRALGRSPAAADALIGVTGDLVPPHRLLSPALLRTFLLDQFRPMEAT
ncbi:MAG: NAD(P)/FAD-dependent oxidoreductase [Gemmatimonadota bacterium]